jgi:hypothetical protein
MGKKVVWAGGVLAVLALAGGGLYVLKQRAEQVAASARARYGLPADGSDFKAARERARTLNYPTPSGAKVVGLSSTYDEFNDKTETKIDVDRVPVKSAQSQVSDGAFSLSSEYKGKTRTEPENYVSFLVSCHSDSSVGFPISDPPVALVDGERIVARLSGIDPISATSQSGGYNLFATFDMETADLLRFVSAKSSRLKYGEFEFSPTAQQLAAMREFVATLKPQ